MEIEKKRIDLIIQNTPQNIEKLNRTLEELIDKEISIDYEMNQRMIIFFDLEKDIYKKLKNNLDSKRTNQAEIKNILDSRKNQKEDNYNGLWTFIWVAILIAIIYSNINTKNKVKKIEKRIYQIEKKMTR